MKRMLVAMSVVLLLGVLMPPASATTTRYLVPYHIDALRTCTGERIAISGQLLLIGNTFTSADGIEHSNFTAVSRQVTGISASGVEYHLRLGLQEMTEERTDGTVMLTFLSQFILISENGDGNLLATSVTHVIIAADGEVTVDVHQLQRRCVG